MGFISKQWLESNPQRNRGHYPEPVVIEAVEITDDWDGEHDVKVLLKATGVGVTGCMFVRFTKEEVEQALPYFLHQSDLTDLTMGDPKRVAVIEALSKLSDTELIWLLRDVLTAKTEYKSPSTSRLNVAEFATEIGLPIQLLLEQLQAAGVGKENEADSICENDKLQLLEHLRQTPNTDTSATGKQKMNAAQQHEQERQQMIACVANSKITREILLKRKPVDFVQLRRLDMDVALMEKALTEDAKNSTP